MTACLPTRLTLSFSSSVRTSPLSVQNPKATNASAAARLIQPVGSAVPRPYPMATEARWTIAVAMVMPSRTGHTLKRVAKVRAMSWDLSPSSATKMTPKETSVLMKTASTEPSGLSDPAGTEMRDLDPACCLDRRSRPPRRSGAARPDVRRRTGVGQYVDRDIGGYSPSLPAMLPVTGPAAHCDGHLT